MSEFNVNFNLVNNEAINGNFTLSNEDEDLITSFLLDSSDNINGLFTVDSVSTVNATFIYRTSPSINAVFKIDYYPMKMSDLTNDADYVQDADYVHTDNNYTDEDKNLISIITDIGDGTQYLSDDGTYKTIEGGVISVNNQTGDVVIDIPTKTSDLTNDSGFISDISGQDLSTANNSVSGFATTEQLAIQNTFNFDYTGTYTEFTKVGDLITGIDYWDTSAKVNKLFTKTITYSGTNPTVIALVDEKNSKTLTTTIAYSGSNITSITKAVT